MSRKKEEIYPPQYGSQTNIAATNTTGQARFDYARAKKFPDVWASVLFALNIAAFLVICASGLSAGVPDGAVTYHVPRSILLAIITIGTLVAAGLTVAYINLLRKYTEKMIHVTFIGSIVCGIAFGLLSVFSGQFFSAICYFFGAACGALFYFFNRSRIPFVAALLEGVIKIADKYPSVYGSTAGAIFLTCVYQSIWGAALVGMFIRYGDNGYAIALFMVFSLYWTCQVISNVLYVTIAGTVSSSYFLEGTTAMPASPVKASAKRAVTSSFGPIAFGSLVIAIIQTFRFVVRSFLARKSALVACLADCIIGCFESFAKFFNDIAFCYVAIYGQSYCESAKSTWNLLETSGWHAVVNDCFVARVIIMGALCVGFLSSGLALLAGWVLLGSYRAWAPFASYSVFFIGVLMMRIGGAVFLSGVNTLYVCLANDSAALARTNPTLFNKVRETYPELVRTSA